MSVAAIATTVGYDSPYAFSNAFKRHTGCSPTHYRQQVSSETPPPPLVMSDRTAR